MNNKPIRKESYDWREGVCKACGVKANNGCCELHTMTCSTCNGFGATTRENWQKLYGKGTNDNFLKDALLVFQKHDTDLVIKIISEGGHYDHGDEPAIEVWYKGDRLFHTWGIFLPDLILETAKWMRENYKNKVLK